MSKRLKANKPAKATYNNLWEETDKDLSRVFIILIAVLPLLVRVKVVEFIAPGIVSAVANTGIKFDVFSYYKWIVLICAAVLVTAILLFKMLAYHYKIRKSYINLPLISLVLLLLISLLISETKGLALIGFYDQYNGTLTCLCLLALLFAAANTRYKEGFSKYIIAALGIFIVINLTINLFHFYEFDLYQNGVLTPLIIPAYFNPTDFSGALWSTLENPNYVSGLAAALFAFFFGLVLMETRLLKTIRDIILAAASFALMLGALSTSGFISLVITSPLIIFVAFLSHERKRTLTAAGITLLMCLLIFMGMNDHNPRVYDETLGFIKQVLPSGQKVSQAVAAESDFNQAAGASGSPANTGEKQPNYFQLPTPGTSAGSGRAYIWAETLKLIKERPLFGYGQDTLTYYFPQNDIYKVAGLGSYRKVTSKPHNWYLGIAYGSGIPALLSLLALFGLHFYYSTRKLLQEQSNEAKVFPAALYLFFCTFAVQWLFNDAVLGSTAIFWVLLGIAVSLNLEKQLINI